MDLRLFFLSLSIEGERYVVRLEKGALVYFANFFDIFISSFILVFVVSGRFQAKSWPYRYDTLEKHYCL